MRSGQFAKLRAPGKGLDADRAGFGESGATFGQWVGRYPPFALLPVRDDAPLPALAGAVLPVLVQGVAAWGAAQQRVPSE